jgi:transposase
MMQLGFNPEQLVFIDETGAKSNLTRRYGRALRGVRLVDRVPYGHWVNTTYVCGLRKSGIVAPHAFTGAMNKARFIDYVRDVLCPVLNPGDMVICDNLPAHKSAEARKLIESAGAMLLRLPAYSPDLNPIEMSFSKLKSILRKEKIRDVGILQEFLHKSPRLFTPTECERYIRHAGYAYTNY